MPGKVVHQRVNFFIGMPIGALSLCLLWYYQYGLELEFALLSRFLIIFFIAFSYNTLVFNPDLDLARYIKPLSWRGFLYIPFIPYSWFFTHRGYSHSILVGTLTRVVYVLSLLCLLLLIYFVIDTQTPYKLYKLNFIHDNYLHFLGLSGLQTIYLRLIDYRWELSTVIAAIIYGDIIHILLDKNVKNS